MSKAGSRLAVFVCNILIVALSAAAILAHFLFPLWRVHIVFPIQEKLLKEMLPEEMENLDVGEIVGDGIPVSVTLEIRTKEVFSSFADTGATAIESTIERNADSVVDQLIPVLEEVAEKALRAAAKQGVNDVLREQIRNFLDPETSDTDARVEELIEKAGFDEEYINTAVDSLIDSIYAENATVDTVAEQALSCVENALEKLRETGEPEFEGATLTEEDKNKIRESTAEALSRVADENGSINMDQFVSSLLLGFLRSENSSGSDAAPEATLLSSESGNTSGESAGSSDGTGNTAGNSGDTEDAQTELKAEVKQFLLDKIPEGTAETIVTGLKIAGGILAFVLFTWAYLILKILFKLFAKNPAIKLKLPIWLGWIPFLVLALIPGALFSLIASGNPAVTAYLPADLLPYLESLEISFFSGGWVAFAAAIALILLSIPYSVFRRRLRRASRYGDEGTED
ncbi:MAG TPA: hypothetical protein IAC57_02600 [Candidatus Scatosoma pullistercoris]|uniref:Uncharacterized protein n=1 Tax=Candidatus Scatosoma pullistercoris TaxID=2840934 RepID=A0A9D1SGB6_9FIRM|nr:hypothetical protein [Candidatus Scatosoma pullistercoris]